MECCFCCAEPVDHVDSYYYAYGGMSTFSYLSVMIFDFLLLLQCSFISHYTTFLEICGCGRCYGLRTATCLRTVVEGRHEEVPCEILLLQCSFISHYTTFLEICGCGRCYGLRTATCLRTVVEGRHEEVPCEILLLQQILFCASWISWRSEDCHKVQVNLVTLFFTYYLGFKQWCLSVSVMVVLIFYECHSIASVLCSCSLIGVVFLFTHALSVQEEIISHYSSYVRQNDSKSVISTFCTPVVLLVTMLLLYLSSSLLSFVGLQLAPNVLMWFFLLLSAFWLYAKFSGMYAKMAFFIDECAMTIWEQVGLFAPNCCQLLLFWEHLLLVWGAPVVAFSLPIVSLTLPIVSGSFSCLCNFK